jgi:hypothetical protein
VEKALADMRNADARTQAEAVLETTLSVYRKKVVSDPYKYGDLSTCLKTLIAMLEER